MSAGELPPNENDTGTREAVRRKFSWPLVIIIVLLAGAAFVGLADVKKFLKVAEDVEPAWLLAAAGAAFLAYIAFTGALWSAARVSGYHTRFRSLLGTSCVSQAVNNLLSSGGLGGLAIRILGFGQLGVPPGSAAAISGVATISNDVICALSLVGAIVYLIRHSEKDLTLREFEVLMSVAVAIVLLFLAAYVSIRVATIRRRIFTFIGHYGERIGRRFVRRGAPGVTTGGFRDDLLRTAELAVSKPSHLVEPVGWMLFDIGFRIACLWASFAAIGHPQPVRRVAAGFIIGLAAGSLSLIPGGIGVVEGSMAAVFHYLGEDIEVAVAAVIVFRLAYYVLPLGAVAVFFGPMLKGRKLARGPATTLPK